MILALIFLLVDILYGIKVSEVNSSFFDKNNTQAMRGFWCLVVIFAHIPVSYQNRIQDMISSFGYIAITFFFMTSAYGLTLSRDSHPEMIVSFWRKRLPKLIIVSIVVDVFFYVIRLLMFGEYNSPLSLLYIDNWVRWLIGCFLAFWIANKLFKEEKKWKIFASILVMIGSLVTYNLSKAGIMTSTIWPTECYGFIWGIALATIKTCFFNAFSKNWIYKMLACLVLSLTLGGLYLQYKWIPFAGDYLLKILLGIAITMFILIANTRIYFGNKISMFLGGISFELYLVHGYVINILDKYYSWDNSGAFIVCSFVISITCAYFIHLIDKNLIGMGKNICKYRMERGHS
ncbi:acyltransferase family protein [Pseudobutyrivibrio sp. ACV-2]|uniref:acyltransferase family protein n=1 Tax=Pseudobutyrivibrio sp. ACV-2 TaxID=1520801 RepID=UPI00147DE97D|nr:acyltransferase [Pseudobutyrivibrio sp. ACV-2]